MDSEKNFDWNKHLRECLDSTVIAVLATREVDGVWAAPVYFSYDQKFNIYFISSKETRHMKDIAKDPKVAVAIFAPPAVSGVFQIALQIEGKAFEVPDRDIEKVYEGRSIRMDRDRQWVPNPREGHFVKEHGGVFMMIKPSMISYVDTRFFGGNSKKVPLQDIIKKNGA